MRKSERGYNLVETLIAMALLGTVLISIITLFYFGRSNVYSGKQMTNAVAVGTRITEDFTALTFQDVMDFFDLSTRTVGTNSVGGQSYANSVVIKTSPLTSITNTNGAALLGKWANLVTSTTFANGKVSLIFMPFTGGAAAASWAAANILQIRAVVEWTETKRTRFLVVDVAKTDRSK